MELNLVVPVEPGAKREKGDEEIHGRLWRVTGPHSPEQIKNLKFHCISYVWGSGIEGDGAFFDCKRPVSDKTRPALEAAIKAAESLRREDTRPQIGKVEAFWIDALCIPQLEGDARQATLERYVDYYPVVANWLTYRSMGYIYSSAVAVIIVLQGPIWNVIETAASGRSPAPFPLSELQLLEQDKWISRVWTYQELVNGADTYFTTTNPDVRTPVVQVQRFLNCVGASLNKWKKENEQGEMGVLENFHYLSILEEALGDILMSGYLERTALSVLSNVGLRDLDAKFPENRLLACLGALTKEASWGTASHSLENLADKLMKVCEARNDYSFIYTSDEKSDDPGLRWRPSTKQRPPNGPAHLRPIINWHSSTPEFGLTGLTQDTHRDEHGFWLDNMVQLRFSASVGQKAVAELERYLFSSTDSGNPHFIHIGIIKPRIGQNLEWSEELFKFLVKIGFTGCPEPQICEMVLFYSQRDIRGLEEVEIFAAASIVWKFGNPGLVRWKEDGVGKYCAGVYAGLLKQEHAEPLLMT